MNPSPAHQTLPLVTERLRVRLWTEADRRRFPPYERRSPRHEVLPVHTLRSRKRRTSGPNSGTSGGARLYTLGRGRQSHRKSRRLTGLARVAFDAPFTPCVEIGWRFLPEYWGTGYALEAARSVMGYAFKVLELPEVVAFTTETNLPSQGLMAAGSGCSTIPPRISIIPRCRRITRSIAMYSTGC